MRTVWIQGDEFLMMSKLKKEARSRGNSAMDEARVLTLTFKKAYAYSFMCCRKSLHPRKRHHGLELGAKKARSDGWH